MKQPKICRFTEPELEVFRRLCNFTPAEMQYFNLRAKDKSNIEISMMMHISESTVYSKDMIAQNKIESLQAQVSQLQLAQATSNVLRFPTSWTYDGGYFPPTVPATGAYSK